MDLYEDVRVRVEKALEVVKRLRADVEEGFQKQEKVMKEAREELAQLK